MQNIMSAVKTLSLGFQICYMKKEKKVIEDFFGDAGYHSIA